MRAVIITNKQEIVNNSNYQGKPDYEVRGMRKKSKAKTKKKKKNKKKKKKRKEKEKTT